MPMIIELPVAMLACARIGAVHSIVFGGFSAESLAERTLDAKAKVLITADGVWRGDKIIHLKEISDKVSKMSIVVHHLPKLAMHKQSNAEQESPNKRKQYDYKVRHNIFNNFTLVLYLLFYLGTFSRWPR
jgi:acyl-coenzyme A synthetase/AMP-(fatty) acid ligase